MLIRAKADLIERIAAAGAENPHDRLDSRPLPAGSPEPAADLSSCIYLTATASGRVPLLKSVMSTACEMNCNYCGMRAGRDQISRETFTPDEMASGFMKLVDRKLVKGIFLSSTLVGGGVRTQDRIIETAEILRGRYRYRGYIHLKIMPWAERDQIARSAVLADRLSLNLEGVDQAHLTQLAPRKEFEQAMFQRLRWSHEIASGRAEESPHNRRVTLATQFVVGPSGETDLDLLALGAKLFTQLNLRRIYFSAFSPIRDTPFDNLAPTDPLREFRLYQASFLMRDYGWDVEDMPFIGPGYLAKEVDPKRAWAEEHLGHHPVEIMSAGPEELMRVPGIGPIGADKIIYARAKGRIRDLKALRQIGVRGVDAAAPYLLLDGQRPLCQMKLF